MVVLNLVLSCLLLAVLPGVFGVGRVVPLLSGWHFDNIQRDSVGFLPSLPPAVVVLWSSAWSTNPEQFGLGRPRAMNVPGLPSRSHLFVGHYDVEQRQKVWWDTSNAAIPYSTVDDPTDVVLPGSPEHLFLDQRFNMTRAPCVVFVPDPRRKEFEVWDGTDPAFGLDWKGWVWARLAFDLRVHNALDVPAAVRVAPAAAAGGEGWDPRAVAATLEPGEEATIRVLPGYRVEAHDANKGAEGDGEGGPPHWVSEPLVRGGAGQCGSLVLGDSGGGGDASTTPEASRAAAAATTKTTVAAAATRTREELRALDEALNARDQDTTFTHAAVLRQPPVMPGFGGEKKAASAAAAQGEETGQEPQRVAAYVLADMPAALTARLWKFYEAHTPAGGVKPPENYPVGSTGINTHAVNTTMVSLDLDFPEKDRIAALIQPLVEEWAGMPLVFTSFYGIREYHRGAELRMHVDRVATHVFSVIINLHQEGASAPHGSPWPLDLIDFDGESHSVPMEPGQMLFYQSAKLVHGRPRPFNGSLYVNAFCHFKPVVGWNFEAGAGDILLHDGEPFVDYKVD